MNKKLSLLLIASSLITGVYQANAAQGTGRATMKVVTALSVTNISDLVFSEAAAGATAETVDSDSVETAQNASFDITGEPNRAITISLPADGTVNMATGGGGTSDSEIAVNQFTSSNPSQIDPSGTTQLFIGATRADLSATQVAGDYEGTFTVDVVYQ